LDMGSCSAIYAGGMFDHFLRRSHFTELRYSFKSA
jgi:hypothetical protein